jgi:hypothetical protein
MNLPGYEMITRRYRMARFVRVFLSGRGTELRCPTWARRWRMPRR